MIIFCASDAGPAAYLSVVASAIKIPFICISTERSRPTFNAHNLPSVDYCKSLCKDDVSLVICGSTFENHAAEFKLFAWAKKMSIFSIVVIYHWTNFTLRIKKFKIGVFPNQIWVIDKWSKQEFIEMNINEQIIKVVGHPVLEKIKPIKSNSGASFNEVIFISE